MKTHRGITLIELLVTISVVSVLVALVAPAMTASISNGRARTVAYKFAQDFTSLRGIAATGTHSVTLTLNGNCSWDSSIDGVVDNVGANLFLSSTQLQTMLGGSLAAFTCASTAGLGTPFTFISQGYVSAPSTVTFTNTNTGQTWTFTVLTSGTIVAN